ncbi:lactaldehyde reductase, partial [Pectobacterium brasiliense]|nr:lactaldehyde reductase [Pectobacterium brasiliense]
RQVSHDVDIPPLLRDVVVREEDIPALAQAAFDDVCSCGNPRDTNID